MTTQCGSCSGTGWMQTDIECVGRGSVYVACEVCDGIVEDRAERPAQVRFRSNEARAADFGAWLRNVPSPDREGADGEQEGEG